MTEQEKRIQELEQEVEELRAIAANAKNVGITQQLEKDLVVTERLQNKIKDLEEKLECAEHTCQVKQEFNDNQFNAIMEYRKKASNVIERMAELLSRLPVNCETLLADAKELIVKE